MTFDEAMSELESAGTEQNRAIYRRHGVSDPLFGVSYAHLKSLKKRIKTDPPLAERLWATGNHDARILATMTADPKLIARETMDAWATALDNDVLADAVSSLAGQSPQALEIAQSWIEADSEWIAAAGWSVLSHCAVKGSGLPEPLMKTTLATIETTIATARNRVRHAMNNTLIAIGGSSAEMEPLAIAVAKRIGKVEVDHGETGCKTPDAVAYIQKMTERARTRSRSSS